MFMHDTERPSDAAAIESLLDNVFGSNRKNKASYRLRDGVEPLHGLSRVVRQGNRLVGTVRFWPVRVRDLLAGSHTDALLLGPLAVDPGLRGGGLGSSLMQQALSLAENAGNKRILLVGDAAYYGRFGFVPVLPSFVTLPGGRDARRLLVRQSAALPSLPPVGRVEPARASEDEREMRPRLAS